MPCREVARGGAPDNGAEDLVTKTFYDENKDHKEYFEGETTCEKMVEDQGEVACEALLEMEDRIWIEDR